MAVSVFFPLFVLSALLFSGCARRPHTPWQDLGMVYASQVPIYPGAQVVDARLGRSAREGPRALMPETRTWRFRTDEDPEKLVAYYEQMLPRAQKSPADDGIVSFTLVPDGAEDGETVIVQVGCGEIRVSEGTKPGKHRESTLGVGLPSPTPRRRRRSGTAARR